MTPKKIIKIYLIFTAGLILFSAMLLKKGSQEKIIEIRDYFLCKDITEERRISNFLRSFKIDRSERFQIFDTPYSYGYLDSSISKNKIVDFFSRNPNLLGANSESKIKYHILKSFSTYEPRREDGKLIDLKSYSIIYNEGTAVPIVIIPSSSIYLAGHFSEMIFYKINSDLGDDPIYNLEIQKIKSKISDCGNYIKEVSYESVDSRRLK